MFTMRKELLKESIKLMKNGETKEIKKKELIAILEQKREKTLNKEDIDLIIYTLPGVKAISIANKKKHIIEVYYEEKNFWHKTPEVIVTNNDTLRRCLIEIFNSLTKWRVP